MSKIFQVPQANIPSTVGLAFPQSKPTDIEAIGTNVISGDSAIVDDWIVKPGAQDAIVGGDFTLAGGMQINIFPLLRLWRGSDGKMFELLGSTPQLITLQAADPSNPRIDIIYVLIEENQPGNEEIRHFKLDPTDEGSPEGDIAVFTELQNRLVVDVVTGDPAPDPQLPALPPNGVAMYEVTVRAGATLLNAVEILDVRHNFRTLEEIDEALTAIEIIINKLKMQDHRHPADRIDIGPGAGKFAGMTDQEAWNIVGNQADENVNDPLTRPEILTPELDPINANSGTLVSVGTLESTTPVVDIPVGRQVAFSDVVRTLEPGRFADQGLQPRIVNKHADAGTQTSNNTLNFTLAVISAVESDGGGAWALESYGMPFAPARAYSGQRLACARNESKIEVMGGGSGGGSSTWFTIDTVAQTVTTRAFSGDIPIWFIKAVLPVGDGVNVLVAQQPGADSGAGGGKLEWFKVNADTGVSVKYTGVAPGYTAAATTGAGPSAVIGDLISTGPGVVLILVNVTGFSGDNAGLGDNKAWLYHADTDTFEKFTPLGPNPLSGLLVNDVLQDIDLCMYQAGEAVLVRGLNGISTHKFTLASRTWTKLNISQPSIRPEITIYGNRLVGVTIANINGRVQLASGSTNMWELTPSDSAPLWTDLGISPGLGSASSGRSHAGMAGLLVGGLPKGAGYLMGGRINNQPQSDIWAFAAGGIIESDCGVAGPGITLAPGVNQASFVIADLVLPWAVGKVLANPRGVLPPNSISLSYSFDGVTFQPVTPNQLTTIASSSTPGTRKLRITLTGTGGGRPCLSSLYEQFEKTGGVTFAQNVLRYNAVTAGVRALYMDRDGVVTLESTILPTTPDKCLLHKVIPAGPSSAPAVKDYINERRPSRRLYTGTRAGGIDPVITNRHCVKHRYAEATKIVAGALQDLATPAITFDNDITVTGLADGQSFRLDVEF
jgi:hypothetical protein